MIIDEVVQSINENFIYNFFTSCLKRRLKNLENEISHAKEDLKSSII